MEFFKRDYVNLSNLADARMVMKQLPALFADYNENHPHSQDGQNFLAGKFPVQKIVFLCLPFLEDLQDVFSFLVRHRSMAQIVNHQYVGS